MTGRPNCAAVPERFTSVTITTRLPPSMGSSVDSTRAVAAPLPFSSRAFEVITISPVSESATSRSRSAAKTRAMGPTFTVTFVFQWVASTVSVNSAPCIQETTIGMSMSTPQTVPGSASTLNSFSIRTGTSDR